MIKKILYTTSLALAFSMSIAAQEALKGVVRDASGTPLAGVRISEVGEPKNNCLTDANGAFTLAVSKGDYIELNWEDASLKRVRVTSDAMGIVLDEHQDAMVDLGFIKRNEQNATQAVSKIYADDFNKKATSRMNMRNSLYGLLSGLHATQNVGWKSGAGLRVRGQGGLDGGAPLILVDGFRRPLTHSILEEIESVQVLKDGAATAMYGTRAANGVILINTKRGQYNSFDIDVNYRHGFNKPINQPEMADAYTYAMAQNEALYYDGLPAQYSPEQLELFKNGTDPYYYPNVNWVKEGTRKFAENNQFNLAMRGGGKKVRYFAILDYKNEFGLLNEDLTHFSDRANTQIRDYELELRLNLDADITPTTQLKFDLFGTITEHKHPNKDIEDIYKDLYTIPAAAFPIRTQNDNWGSNSVFKRNPLATIADIGYLQDNRRLMYADMRLTQDFSMFVKGLSAEIAVGYDNSAVFRDVYTKNYMYEENFFDEEGNPTSQTFGSNTSLQRTESGLNSQILRTTVEAKINYDRSFGAHLFNIAAIYRQEAEDGMKINTSYYRQNIMGVAGYNYANRYMVDVVANYHGTSVLLKDDKFRFYPAISAGWNLANEKFLAHADCLDLLKIRASWGRSAIDNLDYGLGNYFWVDGDGYPFGENVSGVKGLKEEQFPIRNLDLETADKFNIGVDVRLWKNFTATLELYQDNRKNILVDNNNISSMLGLKAPKMNIGEVKSRGLELDLGWHQRVHDFTYYVGGNLALNDSEIKENGQGYQPYEYLYTKGHKVGQLFGLEAIGYFQDEADIQNSPKQMFSEVRPGDIKYRDRNNDGKVDNEDRAAIGKSTAVPEMVYGLNLGFEYKGFGVDLLFNGVTGITKVLNVNGVHRPLKDGKNNISMWYLNDNIRWTESTKENANMPRLSTLPNENNYQTSTQWIKDGGFFKLRNLNVYYNLPQRWVEKMKMDKFQIYARAENVFSIDKIDGFNCEDLTLGYPDLFSAYVGININF